MGALYNPGYGYNGVSFTFGSNPKRAVEQSKTWTVFHFRYHTKKVERVYVQNVSSSNRPPRLITLGLSSSRSSVTFPPAVRRRSSTIRLLASRADGHVSGTDQRKRCLHDRGRRRIIFEIEHENELRVDPNQNHNGCEMQ